MAISTEHEALIIDGFALILRHSDGDTHTLRWSGLAETFSQITDAAGNRQVVARDQTPIALKIGTESLIEKFVRFQEPRFHETERPAFSNLVAHFNFLKQSTPADYVEKTLASKELFTLIDARRKSFWWKPGRYEITLALSSPKRFKLMQSTFQFELTSLDVDQLKQNIPTAELEVRNTISSNLPDFKPPPITWNWANVNIDRPRARR
jgi:hypothetical protein